MRVNVVQNISRMIYGELSEGLSVKIIHSEGVSKGEGAHEIFLHDHIACWVINGKTDECYC